MATTGRPADPVAEPLRVVDALFAAAVAANGGKVPQGDCGVQAHFKSLVNDGNIGNVPLVTKHAMDFGTIKPGTLVRYRGMVQDTFDSEFFPTAYCASDASGNKQYVSGMYRDSIDVPEGVNVETEGMGTRIPVYMVPVPGETAWAAAEAGAGAVAPQAPSTSAARKRSTREEEAPLASSAAAPPASTSPVRSKRIREEPAAGEEGDVALPASPGAGGQAPAAPKGGMQVLGATHEEANSTEPLVHVAQLAKHSPLPDQGGMPALVRMYSPEQPLRVGELVEVLGVLTVTPGDAMVGAGLPAPGEPAAVAAVRAAWAVDKETAAKRPSNALVARVQGILYRRLPPATPMLKVPLAAPGAFRLRGMPEHEVEVAAGARIAAAKEEEARKALREAASKALAGEAASVTALGAAASAALAGFLPTLGAPLGDLRTRVVQFLAGAVGGDLVAGEWLLLHLLSSVTTRVGEEAVGMLHLNLTGFPDASAGAPTTVLPPGTAAAGATPGAGETPPPAVAPRPPGSLASHTSPAARRVHTALSALLPRTALLPLTVAHLNSLQFFPRKDYITNRLLAGTFQLPAGTQVTLDESVMAAGTLLARGIENHTALSHLLAAGTLTYDFGYFPQHNPVDLPTLILSSTKSLFTANAVLPLDAPAAEALAGGALPPLAADEALLDAARKYIACVRSLPYAIDKGMEARIQADWTTARARNPKLVAGDLHRWLSMARLVALSCGDTTLAPAHWAAAIALEEARLGRLPTAPAAENPGVAAAGRAPTPVSPSAGARSPSAMMPPAARSASAATGGTPGSVRSAASGTGAHGPTRLFQ